MSQRNAIFEKAEKLAKSISREERLQLASSQNASPELLYYFASKGVIDERASVAANPTAPVQADIWLSVDESENVRTILAFKAAKLANNDVVFANEEKRNNVLCILENLSKEHFVGTQNASWNGRINIDEASKRVLDMALIDANVKMMGPVLESSSLISDQEIIYLVSNGLCTAGLCAIARRTNLSSMVIDALIKTEDVVVCEALRNNESVVISPTQLMGN